MILHKLSITTDASGDATVISTEAGNGRVYDVQYVPDGATPFDNTADFTITGAVTGRSILAKTNVAAAFTNAPRQATHDTAGAASLYAAGGEPVEDKIAVAEPIKIVVAQGGNAKSGVVYVTVG